MTQEERLLVLVDVSARLPYRVIVDNPDHVGGMWDEVISIDTSTKTVTLLYDGRVFSIDNIKPYLRPMSSMTEKEKRKYDILVEEIVYRPGVLTCSSLINFCHEHHLDGLGLIEKGLALEAPEGMYETE